MKSKNTATAEPVEESQDERLELHRSDGTVFASITTGNFRDREYLLIWAHNSQGTKVRAQGLLTRSGPEFRDSRTVILKRDHTENLVAE